MEEQQQRVNAITSFLQGAAISTICRTLGRSRRWFYKWLKRYDPTNPEWACDRARAPKQISHKTPPAVIRMVCEVRNRLLKTKYAQRGALAIQWQLKQMGIEPLPAIWTINRILKRQGLVDRPTYNPRGTPYPALQVTQPNDVHQFDLVGPRYLKSKERFYGAHLIDAFSNAVALKALSSKRDIEIVDALVAAWQRLGIPRYLQLDNELSFRGSNLYPRSLGLLIRLCLYLGVEVVFIPQGEPWRNGIIEKFNDVYDKLFFRPQQFSTLAHLQRELPQFESFHNRHHRYAKLGQRPPWAVHTSQVRRCLPKSFALHRGSIPWRDGKLSFIRLTDRQGSVQFFTEQFKVAPGLVHEYVRGTIFTKLGVLKFYHQGRVIKVYRYTVNKNPTHV
ncbi:MAG: integrase [Nitrospiraceae bacterium]|nr:MAG: integrase [Nitrospiraceae bacterium]GIW55717.1 MAG: integrase [Nitrospiraceae bacterium]